VVFLEFITDFFLGFSVIAAALITTGLLLIVVEMLRNTKKVFGVTGSVLAVAGTVLRMLNGGGAGTLFFILLFSSLVLFISHLLILRFQKKQWLCQSLNEAIGNVNKSAKSFDFLLGLSGIATDDIIKAGNVTIDNSTFFAASDSFIEKGSPVTVTAVDGEKIFVTKTLDKPERQF
jgi:membrane-bound ClpP family serine protease